MSPKSETTPLPQSVQDFQKQLRALQDALQARSMLPAETDVTDLAPNADAIDWLDQPGLIAFTHDLHGRVTLANRAARIAFGFERAEMVGVEVRHLLAPEYLPRLAEHAADQVERAAPFPFEICANGPHGDLWLEVNPRLRTRNGSIDAIEVFARDITARRAADDTARRDALHDPLTGLPNRRLFMDRLQQAIAQAERGGAKVGVLFLDLDRFKMINDGLGHAAGDEVLRGVADRLLGVMREADTVSRRGGDEFTVLLPQLEDPEVAAALARRVLETIEAPITTSAQAIHVSASIGVAVYPRDGSSADMLVHRADVAMYRAKADGRSCYRFFHPELNSAAKARLDVERSLRDALRDGTMCLEYQPRVDARTDEIVGFEALLRIPAIGGGRVPAADAIRVAEETGLIGPVGEWVIRRACAVLAKMHPAGVAPIFVNVTERECLHADLAAIVRKALADASVEASQLGLDLCHGFAANEDSAARAIMAELHAIGVRLGLDEFGTARTSIRTLRAPYLRSLSIAREYIADLPGEARVAAIAQSMIDLAHALDLDAVAVGVENEAQAEWLRRAGCDQLQGRACGVPLTEQELLGYWRQ